MVTDVIARSYPVDNEGMTGKIQENTAMPHARRNGSTPAGERRVNFICIIGEDGTTPNKRILVDAKLCDP
ncbi:hypothetical protein VP1G_11480 [Cytospora mali]|nr:hypothetical protein VP1G_11480 [Valsa mali var. pyri (nom. inval.)]